MIIYVGGSKGGVGKSMQAMIALHHYVSAGVQPVLIETDTSNPDVYKAYNGKGVSAYAYDIDTEKGWESTLNVIGEALDTDSTTPIVINSGARNTMAIASHGDVLNALGVDIVTLWVINEQLDGLVLLKDYLQTVQQRICIVKNGFFAADEDFDIFKKSNFSKKGIQSVYLPKATAATSKALYVERKALHELNVSLTFGERMLYAGWIKKADAALAQALEIATVYGG